MFVCLLVLLLAGLSFASTAQSCGGIVGTTCPDDRFCNFPVGTCGIGDIEGECATRPQMCTSDWRPVIGCDGNLYSNDCMAAAAGVSIKHAFSPPRSEPESTVDEDPASPSAASLAVVFTGKVRAGGAIERRTGRWTLQSVRSDSHSSRVYVRIAFPRSVRNAVILATPYCSFSDHSAAPASYGYFDDRTVDFVFVSPCGFIDPSGLDFVVVR